ncbi:MAG: glycosyltransferase [Eubacterium sp.]
MDTHMYPSAGDNSDALYIVAPAYNEEETIETFVEDWYPVVARHPGNGRSRLIIVNDGSRDNTYARLMEMKKTRPCLTVLTKPNGGHGHGYRQALARAEKGAQGLTQTYIFQTGRRAHAGQESRRKNGRTLEMKTKAFFCLSVLSLPEARCRQGEYHV